MPILSLAPAQVAVIQAGQAMEHLATSQIEPKLGIDIAAGNIGTAQHFLVLTRG